MSEIRPRILAVDDEARGVELVKRLLRRHYTVETATSGEDAWETFECGSFELVISDQRMPGMSGVELLARIAEHAPATGRILLTGYADSVATVEAINRAHVHAYLSKPCPPDQLCLTVQSVLDRCEMLRENERLARHIRAEGRDPSADSALCELLDWTERLCAEVAALDGDLTGREAGAGERVRLVAEASQQVANLAENLAKAR